jgi:hypothetical protein
MDVAVIGNTGIFLGYNATILTFLRKVFDDNLHNVFLSKVVDQNTNAAVKIDAAFSTLQRNQDYDIVFNGQILSQFRRA